MTYEEAVEDTLRNLVALNKMQSSLKEIDEVVKYAEKLIIAGVEGYVDPNWKECSYCHTKKPAAQQERYSAGVYAGKMCDDCAYSKYRDHCGLDNTPQLTQADVDEDIEPEDYYGMGRDLAEYGA